jgi:hypothetical protein
MTQATLVIVKDKKWSTVLHLPHSQNWDSNPTMVQSFLSGWFGLLREVVYFQNGGRQVEPFLFWWPLL